ncbi:transcription elongation factor GreA [Polymorphobacter sp.]|uniref:transcription elongation factor GreA n=1 Tax=Polymorphobacter sp. TaxID=1909290 RepID=UPI003F725469
MSVAFTKESDAESVAADLPDRPIPAHANLVTPAGLIAIETALAEARAAYAAAQANDGISADRSAMARATRDLRYWSARRASARVIDARPEAGRAGFNTSITFEHEDGSSRTYRIVGDDEADPATGLISWASPVARALTGRSLGDTVSLPTGDVEITAIA